MKQNFNAFETQGLIKPLAPKKYNAKNIIRSDSISGLFFELSALVLYPYCQAALERGFDLCECMSASEAGICLSGLASCLSG